MLTESPKPSTPRLYAAGYSVAVGEDGQMRFNRMSKRFLTMTDFARDELAQTPGLIFSRIHRDDRKSFIHTARAALRNHAMFLWEGRLTFRGEPRWIVVEAYPSLEGTSWFWDGVVVDITLSKQQQSELEERERMYRTVLETTSEGFWMVDMNGRLLEVNDAYCRMSGYSRDELLEMDISQLEALHSADEILDNIATVRAKGHLSFGALHLGKSGERIPVHVCVNFNPELGDRLFAFFHDLRDEASQQITRKTVKDIETAVRRRIDDADATFVNISEVTLRQIGQELHDDLGQMLVASSLLAKSLVRKLDKTGPGVAELGKQLETQLNTAIGKVRQISYGLYPVGLDSIGMQAMLAQLVDNARHSAGMDATLDVRCPLDLLDGQQTLHIYRVMQEAISNVIRHSGASEIRVELYCTGHQFHASVTDNGVGVLASDHQRKGIGFATMRARCNVIGAELRIESVQPHGTRISLVMPMPLSGPAVSHD